MDGIQITWTFAVLEALAFAVVAAVEGETKVWRLTLPSRLFLYFRALLAGGAFVASQVYQSPSPLVMVGLGALAVVLGVLGYWPKVQQVGARLAE
jgi:hypothetical protein